jgi:hypothetical protein
MARAAYYGGADFFYRVNDDTELMSKWALTFVTAIDSLPLPGGEWVVADLICCYMM